MISMKQIIAHSNRLFAVLCTLMISVGVFAQRDFSLIENSNAWLTSGNAAALISYSDSTISRAALCYGYEGGRYRGSFAGKDEMTLLANACSYFRLSDHVMSYGSVSYTNFSGTDMSGSMLNIGRSSGFEIKNQDIVPFDILQSEEDAGRKHMEKFNAIGAFGWNIAKGLSVGAGADFSAGSYAKYKDLRHSNTLMNLHTNASVFYSLGKPGIGASFLYNRSTETVNYKTYGTTDHIYQVLLDYANQQGETLTYGGDGFIDDNTELPLFEEQCGFSVQGSLSALRSQLYAKITYLHRHGYYGKQSQYTASYEQHHGNSYGIDVRLTFPKTCNTLSWLDFTLNAQKLTTFKNNYRQVKSVENNSVTFYEYYAPTKMSDKAFNSGKLCYTLYAIPAGAIYLWQLDAGTGFLFSKQTAYLYPEMSTREVSLWAPFVCGKRNILFNNTAMFSISAGIGAQCGNMDILKDGIGRQLHQSLMLRYEFPLWRIRPNISLHYNCAESNDVAYNNTYRHQLMFSVGAIF